MPVTNDRPAQVVTHTDRAEKVAKRQLTHTLNVLQLNVCGIRPKQPEVLKLLHERDVDVALFQETLLKGKPFHLTGYSLYHCKCGVKCRGIATAVRDDLAIEVLETKCLNNTDTITIKVHKCDKSYVITNVYNRPRNPITLPIGTETIFDRRIIAGDFNAQSSDLGYADRNPSGRYIEEVALNTNLIRLQSAESPLLYCIRDIAPNPDQTYL